MKYDKTSLSALERWFPVIVRCLREFDSATAINYWFQSEPLRDRQNNFCNKWHIYVAPIYVCYEEFIGKWIVTPLPCSQSSWRSTAGAFSAFIYNRTIKERNFVCGLSWVKPTIRTNHFRIEKCLKLELGKHQDYL